MARYKNGIQRVSRRQTQNFEDDSSFMMDLSSLQENNIALAKALAKQKEIQKQIRNMETTNNILRSKSRMCVALVREDVSVMTEVIRELSTFLNNILLVITDMRRQTEKCETILRMVDNDNPDVSGSGVMSRTQLVNPMVKGHTLKKATIHLKRLDLSNLNLSLNDVVDVDDAPRTPPAPSEASDLTEEIMSEDEMAPERDTRPRSPAVSDLTEEITSEDETLLVGDTRPQSPAVSEDNLEVGVVQVEDRDENQTLLQDENMLTNQPMSEDSTLIDVSIQNKYPRQSLQMVRHPIVTLERLDMFPGPSTSSNSSSSWVELGEPPGPGQVMNGSDREHGQDVHSGTSDSTTCIPTLGNNCEKLFSLSAKGESCRNRRKMRPRVSLVDIGNCVLSNKSTASQKTCNKANSEVIYCQKVRKLMPRVSLVDIALNKTASNRRKSPLNNNVNSDVIYYMNRNKLSPQVCLVDIRDARKSNAAPSDDNDVIYCGNITPQVNIASSSGNSHCRNLSRDLEADVIYCHNIEKQMPTVRLVDIEKAVVSKKKRTRCQKNPSDDDDVIYCQEVSKLIPRVTLVDIGNGIVSKTTNSNNPKACDTVPYSEEISNTTTGRTVENSVIMGNGATSVSRDVIFKLSPRVNLTHISIGAQQKRDKVAGSRVTNKKTSSPLGVDFGGGDQSLEMRQSSSEKSASPQSRNRRKKSPPLPSSPSGHRNCRVLDKKKTSEKKVLSNTSNSPGNSRGQKRKSPSPVNLRTSEKLSSGDRSFPSPERSVRRGRKKKVVSQVSENDKSSECLQTSEKKGVRVSSSGSNNKVHKKKSSFSTNRVSENGGVSGGRLLCRDVITIKDEDSSSLRTAVSGRGRRKKTSSSVEISNNVQQVEKVEATASIDIPDDSLAGSESDRNRTTTPVLVEFVDHIVLSDDNMDMLPLSILTNYCQAQKKKKSTGPMNGTDGVSEVIKSNVVPQIDLNVRIKDERNHRAESLPLAQVAQTSQSSAETPLFFVESPVHSSNSDHRERTPPSHVTREFGMHQETHRPDESPPGSLAFRNLTRPIITYQNRRKTAVVKDLRESLSLNSRTVEELPRRDAELTLPLVSSEKASSGANPNLIQRLQEQMSSNVKSLDRVNSFLKPAVVSAVAAVNSSPSREEEEEDPLEGPSWLYDSQDTRSSLKKRKLLSSDPTFIIYSSDDSSDESPAVVKKKKRTVKRGRPRLICNLKKSPASIESHVDVKEVRRSLRCQQSRKTK